MTKLRERVLRQPLERLERRFDLGRRRRVRYVPSKPEMNQHPDERDVIGKPVDQEFEFARASSIPIRPVSLSSPRRRAFNVPFGGT